VTRLEIAFLVCLALYVLFALMTNPRRAADQRDQTTTAGVLLQSPLFVLACWLGWRHGVFSRDWVSPFPILAGLALGHVVFAASLCLTHRDLGAAWRVLLDLRGVARHVRDHPDTLFRVLGVAVSEEVIYRGAAQPLLMTRLGHAPLAILLVALAFAVVHWHFFRNPPLQSAEFFGFSVLLGALYYATGSIMLVVVIHAVRNVEIAHLEHCIELEEESGKPGADLPPQAARPPHLA
jgi:membrane protease YdiL (CAAX protease family)